MHLYLVKTTYMFSSKTRITRAFKNAKNLPLNKDSKYVFFSDCHRGDNSFADDFVHNKKIYMYALQRYLQKEFTYIELGDGDELWENSFKNIFEANKYVYLLLKEFHLKDKLHFIWGNHDMDYRNPKKVEKNLAYYFDTIDGKEKELMINASFSEAIRLTQEDGKSIFLLHGHQADWFNYTFWRLSKFLVRILWRPLQLIGIKDPTSPAQNFKELIKVEHRLEKWIKENNNQMIITGHTHRQGFLLMMNYLILMMAVVYIPDVLRGLELENNEITLIKWHVITNENGTMQIVRTVLEGPQNISNYI